MNDDYSAGQLCETCLSDNTIFLNIRAGLSYYECLECGHCTKVHELSISEEFEAEQVKYFREGSRSIIGRPSLWDYEMLSTRARMVVRYLACPSSVVEVGPGAGHFIEMMLAMGHHCRAYEHSPELAHDLESRLGVTVLIGEFEMHAADSLAKERDAVFSFHVIEHVKDPRLHMEQSLNCVASGGLCFIATPNARSWQQVLFKKLSPHFDSAHLRVFSKDSLRQVCESVGWEVLEIRTPEYTIGWLRVLTKFLRRMRHEDEEQSAGKYSRAPSNNSRHIYAVFYILTLPFRHLQERLQGGNELFLVLKKP
jgi:2-polyprenyl-3-methyl-5-hydroxy-6-metoxy-1,4-benzoquinol methylase